MGLVVISFRFGLEGLDLRLALLFKKDLDPSFGLVELARAKPCQADPLLEGGEGLVQRELAQFHLPDDLLELRQGVLELGLCHCVILLRSW
jgi:hypothetical protein